MITRANMATDLALSSSSSTKTYVIEVHADDSEECLRSLNGGVEATEDQFLHRVRTPSAIYWVDQLDGRFWRFHTDARKSDALPELKEWVSGRPDLDWIWLPSGHLRHMWGGARTRQVRTDFRGTRLVSQQAPTRDLRVGTTGADAEGLLDFIGESDRYRSSVSFEAVELEIADREFGSVREAINRKGHFAASGESLELHLAFVSRVVDRYRQLVETCERKAMQWQGADSEGASGGILVGGPIVVRFSRTIDDLESFTDELTSSRDPFRLWGIASSTGRVFEVQAVDLHVGQTLQFDIADNWMRIYLQKGSCGNTVARLITNLQHRFDSALTVSDPEIDQAMRGTVDRTSSQER